MNPSESSNLSFSARAPHIMQDMGCFYANIYYILWFLLVSYTISKWNSGRNKQKIILFKTEKIRSTTDTTTDIKGA